MKVELTQHDDQLRVEVRDWGVGFKLDRVGEGHFGLEGIQERAKVFGGHAVVKSSLRKGTDVVVELPLHPVSLGGDSRSLLLKGWHDAVRPITGRNPGQGSPCLRTE